MSDLKKKRKEKHHSLALALTLIVTVGPNHPATSHCCQTVVHCTVFNTPTLHKSIPESSQDNWRQHWTRVWIPIDSTIQRNGWRMHWQAHHSLHTFCTESGITFSNSPCPQLLAELLVKMPFFSKSDVDMLLALVQRLFRPRIRHKFAWIPHWRHGTE